MGPAGANAAEALRVLLGQYLSDPALEAVPLTAILSIQAAAEGQQKECDYVLYVGRCSSFIKCEEKCPKTL